jgi:hypothetical protein
MRRLLAILFLGSGISIAADVAKPPTLAEAQAFVDHAQAKLLDLTPLVAPKDADPGYDLTAILKSKNTQPLDMVRYGEQFFTSLGFAPLPETFWERSLFVKPRDRDVVCHAIAWDVDQVDDLRIKLCIEINADDFSIIHDELGHNFYQRAYDQQPFLFRDGANDGFHEAIGDTIALWRMRLQCQGIAPPIDSSERDFDPGAKYHVPANFPYVRYFMADILQFQFHRALAKVAGCTGPLNRCSIYASQAAGDRSNAMPSMGLSRPWPRALEALTGQKQMDATAILDYFAPLKVWLE